jgi:hypothetical protein
VSIGGNDDQNPVRPCEEQFPAFEDRPPAVEDQSAAVILERHRAQLHALPGVLGVALGQTVTGDDAIVVFLSDASAAANVPSEIEGTPVETVVTGPIDAL